MIDNDKRERLHDMMKKRQGKLKIAFYYFSNKRQKTLERNNLQGVQKILPEWKVEIFFWSQENLVSVPSDHALAVHM